MLRGVSVIAAEDTRRTGQLLHLEDVATPMLAYHEHSSAAVSERLVNRLQGGESIALVSDAGTPMISDPGYRLVRAVQDAGLKVVPVPGACAVIAALSAAGLPSDRFSFEGFLPSKSEARRRRLEVLEALESSASTLVFYEAPHRLKDTLRDMLEVFGGDREAAIARELTKSYETIRRASLAELVDWVMGDANQSRGELVVLLGPDQTKREAQLDPALGKLLRAMAEHMPARQAAKLLGAYAGLRTRDLYDYLISHKGE